jgi:hypothetical protein
MDDLIREARDAFKECKEADQHNHDDYLEDVRFARLGEQWDKEIRQQRELEHRPILTVNKLAPIIRQVVNDSRQNKPSIKVHPVDDDADPETAELISGLIRNIEATSDADVAYDTGVECAVSGGFGYWKVNIEHTRDDTFEQDIAIRRVSNPLSIYGDPRGTAADSSDWMVAFEVEQMSKDAFKRRFANADAVDWEGAEWQKIGAPWLDADNVQVASWWMREEVEKQILGLSDGTVICLDDYKAQKALFDAAGLTVMIDPRPVPSFKVTQRIMSGAEELKKVDWVGKYIPIIPVYGDEVNVEGKRYFRSLIRDAKDPARMLNYWRTTSTEMIALAPRVPYIGRTGSFETDREKWETSNSASHAYLEYDGQDAPQRQPLPPTAMAAIQEALNAADDIKAVTGIYDASLGAKSNETSGRAIEVRQREGDVSTYHFIDNVSRAIRHTGRIIIDLIPKVYNTERIIRTLGEDGTPETKPINKQYEVKPAGQDKQGNPVEAEVAMHDLRVGKYDLTVSSGPAFSTRRQEAAEQMMQLVQAFPDAAPIIGDLIAKNLDWPGADEVAKRLKGMLPPNLQGEDEGGKPDPEKAALEAQIQQMQQVIDEGMQHISQIEADKSIENEKLQIDRYNAETNRIKAVAPALMPDANAMRPIIMDLLQELLGSAANDLQPEPAEVPYPGQPEQSGPDGMAA